MNCIALHGGGGGGATFLHLLVVADVCVCDSDHNACALSLPGVAPPLKTIKWTLLMLPSPIVLIATQMGIVLFK